jgi:hypothetical protein
MGIVTFNYANWALRFPELATVVDEQLATLYFGEATDFLNNTDCSPVEDLDRRTRWLYLLTAHIAALALPARGGLVGRLSSVTQGSITISSEYVTPGSGAWYQQTPWGAEYWALTAGYRSMQYVPGPRPFLGVPGYGGRGWGPGFGGGWYG